MKKLIALMLLLGCGSVSAYPLTWTVDAVFSDGGASGRLTGTFNYDADTNQYTAINLSLPPFGVRPDSNYTDSDLQGEATANVIQLFRGAGDELRLQYDGNLTNAGGIYNLLAVDLDCYDCSYDSRSDGSFRSFERGTIPAEVWLFGSALAGVGWVRRTQTA